MTTKQSFNRKSLALIGGFGTLAAVLVGCASLPSDAELDAEARAMVRASFREQGIAKLDRIEQDLAQQACSSEQQPDEATTKRIESEQLATVKWPANGQYLGDWREGEKLAQNGRGMTWTDAAGSPSGGNCYNCHQISKAEISFGTIGPSLYQYGKLRGVSNPAAPESAAIVQYTWGKIWNAKAYNACSGMPRFGHAGVLNEAQVRDIMALLLDPKSPVNAQ
ncbi:sulfur oxidation c-type cytochrome SoxX [Roseateles sp. DAIF2]|uniref:sulfur oxidation c-type cytochrome SoxX n=1 Tax=Roseateles sp. DAIF2 TaxID=2714952 RepID=UPI0018A2F60B|nr:sulfur oxidation c-type cytochrome SoxX [Roseateles sp. DAIF2]QPF76255.1 sulfur oxidation c-type cytochrome SoxX [Roseateles sp. DAIF2]